MVKHEMMKNRDLLAVRAFCTARDATNRDFVHADAVIVDITHSNLRQRHAEIRLCRSNTLADLRHKIHRQTGTGAAHQHLHVYDNNSVLVCEIPASAADSYKIGYFLEQHGMTIHVVDANPLSVSAGRALEDVSLVPKFRLTDAAYDQKKNTLRHWKKQQLLNDPSGPRRARSPTCSSFG